MKHARLSGRVADVSSVLGHFAVSSGQQSSKLGRVITSSYSRSGRQEDSRAITLTWICMAVQPFERSVQIYQSTRRNIPDDLYFSFKMTYIVFRHELFTDLSFLFISLIFCNIICHFIKTEWMFCSIQRFPISDTVLLS